MFHSGTAFCAQKLHAVKSSHDQVLYEMDLLNGQLKEEQNRGLSLQNELMAGTTSQRTLIEVGSHHAALRY